MQWLPSVRMRCPSPHYTRPCSQATLSTTSTHRLLGLSRRAIGCDSVRVQEPRTTFFLESVVAVVAARTASAAAPRAPVATGEQTAGAHEATAGVVEEFAHIFLTAGRKGGGSCRCVRAARRTCVAMSVYRWTYCQACAHDTARVSSG